MKKRFLQCLFCGALCTTTMIGAVKNDCHITTCSVSAEEVSVVPEVKHSSSSVPQARIINAEELVLNDFIEEDESLLEEEMYYDSLEWLVALVEAEAGNQDLLGKRLVVDTVLNRVDSESFPDDIMSVIFDSGEFSPVSDGRIYTVSVSEESYEAVRLELENRTDNEVLYFRTEHYHNFGTELFQHGAHYFSK